MIVKIKEKRLEIFHKVFESSFGYYNTTSNPPDVFIQFDKKNRASIMYSGYAHDKLTWYSHYTCRIFPNDDTEEMFNEWLIFLKEKGYRYMFCTIENDNMPSIMRCLKSGFKIVGTRTPPGSGDVILELIKDLGEIQ